MASKQPIAPILREILALNNKKCENSFVIRKLFLTFTADLGEVCPFSGLFYPLGGGAEVY